MSPCHAQFRFLQSNFYEYRVKKGLLLSRPQAEMSLNKFSMAGNDLVIPGQGEFG
jgi:hypothetical protein